MSPVRIREARAANLRHLAPIEDAGLGLFEEVLGDLTGDVLATPAPSGWDRIDQPGFVLVASLGPTEEPVGFAHVLDLDGHAHLEQLSVRPDHYRQGIGSRLVEAAAETARRSGYRELTLCTYRDLTWNGPFYAGLGFVEDDRPPAYLREVRAHEQDLGLDRHGVRIVMTRPLRG